MKKLIGLLLMFFTLSNYSYADAGAIDIINGYAANSDYKLFTTPEYRVENEVEESLKNINSIVCIVSNFKTENEQFIGQSYKALINGGTCGITNNHPLKAVISTSRVDNNSPQETDFWFGSGGIGHVSASASNEFTLKFSGNDGKSLFEINPNYIKLSDKYDNAKYARNKRLVTDYSNNSGKIINYRQNYTGSRSSGNDGSSSSTTSGTKTINFAFDTTYLYSDTQSTDLTTATKTTTSGSVVSTSTLTTSTSSCFNRSNPIDVANYYKIYNYSDGSEKVINTGFGFNYTANDNTTKYGYISSSGIWTEESIYGSSSTYTYIYIYTYPATITRYSDSAVFGLSYTGLTFTGNATTTTTHINDSDITITGSNGSNVASFDKVLKLEVAYKQADAHNASIAIEDGTYTMYYSGNYPYFYSVNDSTQTFTGNTQTRGITLKDGTLLVDKNNTDNKYISKASTYQRFYATTDINNCNDIKDIKPNTALPSLDIDTSDIKTQDDKPTVGNAFDVINGVVQ